MKYINRGDILGLLLDAANGEGTTRTKLMYKAYLSFHIFKSKSKRLPRLIATQLVS